MDERFSLAKIDKIRREGLTSSGMDNAIADLMEAVRALEAQGKELKAHFEDRLDRREGTHGYILGKLEALEKRQPKSCENCGSDHKDNSCHSPYVINRLKDCINLDRKYHTPKPAKEENSVDTPNCTLCIHVACFGNCKGFTAYTPALAKEEGEKVNFVQIVPGSFRGCSNCRTHPDNCIVRRTCPESKFSYWRAQEHYEEPNSVNGKKCSILKETSTTYSAESKPQSEALLRVNVVDGPHGRYIHYAKLSAHGAMTTYASNVNPADLIPASRLKRAEELLDKLDEWALPPKDLQQEIDAFREGRG